MSIKLKKKKTAQKMSLSLTRMGRHAKVSVIYVEMKFRKMKNGFIEVHKELNAIIRSNFMFSLRGAYFKFDFV